ncbi:MAG: hypothetical protein HYS52_00795 [Candidatus Wildermuthbacteria bacterium]|nr:hypothetical protein [Candidatus Wildermuthbacteria bacterium]
MAGTTVTGDLYRQIDKKLEEIKRQLRQKVGYPFDPMKLQKGLQALIEGRFQDESPSISISIFSRDMTKEGWELAEGSDEPDPTLLSAAEFEFVPILEKGENFISGEAMRKRASQKNANFGQHTAEWLLAHPEKMPARPEDVYWILFPRTVWSRRRGDLDVPYLRWVGARWVLEFHRLGDEWYSYVGFLRQCK